MNLQRTIWRQWLKLRFHLFQRHRFNRLVLESVAGRPFLILPEVFNPTLFLTSDFMVAAFTEQLIPSGSRVLDMGTGSGVGAVFAAQWAAQVVAIDINPAAARSARINVLLNQVDDCVEVHEGDLFTTVPGERFDIILFNPPYFPGEPQNTLDRAFRANDVLTRFAAQVGDHLNPGGFILLLLSSDAAVDNILQLFHSRGFLPEVASQKNLPSETVWLYRLTPIARL